MFDHVYDNGIEDELDEQELKVYRESAEEFLDFLENAPLYQPVQLTYEKLFNISTLGSSFQVSAYCEKCNTVHYFQANEYLTDEFSYLMEMLDDEWKTVEFACDIELECKECGETHHIPILIKDGQMQKIGQYPPYDENLTVAKWKETH